MKFGYYLSATTRSCFIFNGEDTSCITNQVDVHDAKEITISIKSDNGDINETIFRKTENGNWLSDNEEIKIIDENIVNEYFTECKEDNGYDMTQIKTLALKYRLSEDQVKSMVDAYRQIFIEKN